MPLDDEVNPVMSGMLNNGFEVSALHNHLNSVSPHMMYMHYDGHGDAVQFAQGLHQASPCCVAAATGGEDDD